MMYFSRVTVVPELLTRGQRMKMFAGNNYNDHQMLWHLFDEDERQFLFRREQGGTQPYVHVGQNQALPVYYLVSKVKPQDAVGLNVMTKDYQPVIKQGMTFGFTLRANPVVAKKSEGKKHSARHDVLLLAKQQAKAEELTGGKKQQMIDEAAKNWLLSRAENNGFAIDSSALLYDGYTSHSFFKAKAKSPIKLATVDYNGLLTVTDPTKFTKALFEGIGRAKGFGCGMLMIRKVA